nr:cytochrome P450 [Ipomoea batatas]
MMPEAFVVREALGWIKQHGLIHAKAEVDYFNFILSVLHYSNKHSHAGSIAHECRHWLISSLIGYEVRYIRRDGNRVAHVLVKEKEKSNRRNGVKHVPSEESQVLGLGLVRNNVREIKHRAFQHRKRLQDELSNGSGAASNVYQPLLNLESLSQNSHIGAPWAASKGVDSSDSSFLENQSPKTCHGATMTGSTMSRAKGDRFGIWVLRSNFEEAVRTYPSSSS